MVNILKVHRGRNLARRQILRVNLNISKMLIENEIEITYAEYYFARPVLTERVLVLIANNTSGQVTLSLSLN